MTLKLIVRKLFVVLFIWIFNIYNFNSLIKLFSSLYIIKFLDISKLCSSCDKWITRTAYGLEKKGKAFL